MAIPQFRLAYPRLTIGCTEKGTICYAGTPWKFFVTLQKWADQCSVVDNHSEVGQRNLSDPRNRDPCLVEFGEPDDW